MGTVKPFPTLEAWMESRGQAWSLLSDREYRSCRSSWSNTFQHRIERRWQHVKGDRGILDFESELPSSVFLICGISIPEVGNLGGPCASGYRIDSCDSLDLGLCSSLELVVIDPDYRWCLLLSHETSGGMCHPEFWVA
jgi:hypothetical protein